MASFLENVKSILPTQLGGRGGLPGVFGTEAPQRGDEQLLKMYSQSPWLRAVTNKIGREVGKSDWQLFVPRDANGRAFLNKDLAFRSSDSRAKEIQRAIDLEELEVVKNHPFLDMMARGNEAMSGLVALQVTQLHMDLLGEAFWIIERNNAGTPVAYWPIPPTWVKDLPSRERMSYIIAAENRRNENVELPISEVVHFKDPDPRKPYSRGTGIARSLGDEIEIDEFSGKHVKNVFWNRARPDIIITGDTFNREDAERVEKKWKDNHRGFWNSFKPLFINRKVDVKELSQSFESMQLTSLRKHERDTIIQTFGVPPEKLGILSQCFDDQTECLTDSGWKHWEDVSYDDKIGTWNIESGCIEYQNPLCLYQYYHVGKMHHWNSPSASVKVTPNHRMLESYRTGKNNRTPESWYFLQSQHRHLQPDSRLTYWRVSGGGYKSSQTERDLVYIGDKAVSLIDLARFLGFWISEGSLHDHDGAKSVRLSQHAGPLADEMAESISRVSTKTPNVYRHNRRYGHGERVTDEISVYDSDLFNWLEENCGRGSLNKRVPSIVFTWPESAQRELLDSYIDGDGHWSRYGDYKRGVYKDTSASTVSKQLADDIQRICVNVGIRCRIKERHYDNAAWNKQYILRLSDNPEYCFYGKKHSGQMAVNEVHYEGYVYCAEVPNGTLITRRDGCVSIHGNSNRSTIEASDEIFQSDVIVPRLELIRSELQRQLMPQFDERLILHFISPVKEDRELQLQIMRAFPPAYTANDWRELSGHEKLPEDFLLIPANETPVPVDNPIAGASEARDKTLEAQKETTLPAPRKEIEEQVRRRIAKSLSREPRTKH